VMVAAHVLLSQHGHHSSAIFQAWRTWLHRGATRGVMKSDYPLII
jgi:hypothetical protein